MIQGIYVVYNSDALESAEPFVAKTDKVAIQKFVDTMRAQIADAKSKKYSLNLSAITLRRLYVYDTENLSDLTVLDKGSSDCGGRFNVDVGRSEVLFSAKDVGEWTEDDVE